MRRWKRQNNGEEESFLLFFLFGISCSAGCSQQVAQQLIKRFNQNNENWKKRRKCIDFHQLRSYNRGVMKATPCGEATFLRQID
jgi:serine/threonine protein phosphatase PrpC